MSNPQSPDQDVWMQLPVQKVGGNVPCGLLYLRTLDEVIVKNKSFFISSDKYSIKNAREEKIYYAIEDFDDCFDQSCHSRPKSRAFEMKIVDRSENEVIHLSRDVTCEGACLSCCPHTLVVCSPPGNLIGTVEQTGVFYEFDIKNEVGATVMKIQGSLFSSSFQVLSLDGRSKVGEISRRSMLTILDYYCVTFPLDLDVRMKAVMIGACILIDFMYYRR